MVLVEVVREDTSDVIDRFCEVLSILPFLHNMSRVMYDEKITVEQLRIMDIVMRHGPLRIKDLAERMKVSSPTITGILDRLVARRLTYRAHGKIDRKSVICYLTADGRDLLERIFRNREGLEEFFSRLDGPELNKIIEFISVLERHWIFLETTV